MAALKNRPPRLAELAALAAGVGSAAATTEVDLLRSVAQLAPPGQERVAEVVADLREAARTLDATRGTPAEESRLLADLLQHALDHHERHRDQVGCPVCARTTSAWNGWGCVTGTMPTVASNTAAARSSRPDTWAPSHCPPSRRVAGPSTHVTGSAAASTADSASTSASTYRSSTCPSGGSFTIHCSGAAQITFGTGSRRTCLSTWTISGGGQSATDSRATSTWWHASDGWLERQRVSRRP